MPEIQKYSYVEELKKADEKYKNSIALAGPSNLTFFSANNAMRTVMFTNHLKQFLNLVEPEFPLIFTNMENLVGKHSTGYYKTKNDSVLYRKIVKFDDILDSPKISTVFIYDKVKDKYRVKEVQPVEDLVENFGFEYDTSVIDSMEEGDDIPADTVLYRSTSYDKDMNYRYGKNIVTMYTLDPYTSEDAAVASQSLTKMLESTQVETCTIRLNDNDYLLNMRGDEYEYKPLPEVGETVSEYLAVIRRLFNDQVMFDFKTESLVHPHEGDIKMYLPAGDYVVEDYTIYSNNEEIEEGNPFTDQINKYLKSQNKYYQEILETCEEIMNSGSKYTKDVDYLYKRAKEMLDPINKKWKEGDNAFSNVQIKVKLSKRTPLSVGSKISGRYGNKSVISQIRKDEEMPHTEDGRRVDLMLNLLAIINRTTAFVLYETQVNAMNYQIRRKMSELKTLPQKAKLLFDALEIYNEDQANIFRTQYNDMTTDEKREFIQETIDNGIYIEQPPMFEKESMFYRIDKLMKKFDWLGPEVCYINKFGRRIKMLRKQWVGEMYIIKLKQTDQRGFSVRSTGSIDGRGLPTRSFKSKDHQEPHSDKPIRFGEYESLNFSIGTPAQDIALLHALTRTATKGREDIVKMSFKDQRGMLSVQDIGPTYSSIVVEILEVLLKSLSLKLDFVDPDNDVRTFEMDEESVYNVGEQVLITSEYQYELYRRMVDIKNEILEDAPFITKEDFMDELKSRLKSGRYVIGPTDLEECEFIDELFDL